MERSGKVAIPLLAVCVKVPFKEPLPGLVLMAMVIEAELLVTTLFWASSTCTVIAGVIVVLTAVLEG
jgi:hypothetical protein